MSLLLVRFLYDWKYKLASHPLLPSAMQTCEKRNNYIILCTAANDKPYACSVQLRVKVSRLVFCCFYRLRHDLPVAASISVIMRFCVTDDKRRRNTDQAVAM